MRFSRQRTSSQKAKLTQKYGVENVQALIIHLEQTLSSSSQFDNFQQAEKIKDQIQYLKQQKNNFITKQSNQINNHIMKCVDEEKMKILKQFEDEKKKNLQQILKEIQSIQKQMDILHQQECDKLEEQMDAKIKKFKNKTSHNVTNYFQQIYDLCKYQQYYEAEGVKNQLQKEFLQQGKKKYYEWKNYKEKQKKTLACKQQKQREALKTRLEALLLEEIKCKSEDYIILVKKIQIKKKKIYQSLIKDSPIHKQIQTLVSSRCLSKRSKKDCLQQKQIKNYTQAQPQSDLSIGHPLTSNTPLRIRSIGNCYNQ